jgi:ketosteroid isomerase-like protein
MIIMACAARLATAADSPAAAQGPAPAAQSQAVAQGLEADLRKASAAYAEAYNNRDYAALAAQWATQAELVEGDVRIVGRDAIVASIRGWLERHPQARLAVTVTGVEQVAGPLVRVRGVLSFTRRPGEKPVASPFVSLRVLEGGAWRLAESIVAPNHAAALEELGWLVGTWQASDAKEGTTVEMRYEKAAGGEALVGRMTTRPKQGAVIESLDVIHADRATGAVRSWLFDSTGARAEGVFSADGTGFNRSFTGTPAAGTGSGRTAWTQVLVPGGDGRFTLQSIERSIDGQPLPDNPPLYFKRK